MMVAYSFQAMFIAPILAGTKRQTIRADRKRHARVGEQIQLYTAMRTKYCRQIGTATCIAVKKIDMLFDYGFDGVFIDGREIDFSLDRFAEYDGFDSWFHLRKFWARHHPGINKFTGVIVAWENLLRP